MELLTPSATADQNPCHCKVVGPTLGFAVAVCSAVVCWPAALLCGMALVPVLSSGTLANLSFIGCCMTDLGKKYAALILLLVSLMDC